MNYAALLFTIFFIPLAWGDFTVIIDPGHGGTDTGATVKKLTESKLTLKVGKRLQKYLNQLEGFSAQLTRQSNRKISLENRSKMANLEKADLFISIHGNSSPDNAAKGAEFYFQNQLAPEEESMYLANLENASAKSTSLSLMPKPKSMTEAILLDMKRNHNITLSAQLAQSLYKNWQGRRKSKKNSIKQAPFYVISNVTMPSILVELGFITNSRDRQKLSDPKYLNLLARGISKAIVDYKVQLEQK